MGRVEIAHPGAILSNLVAALGGAGCRQVLPAGWHVHQVPKSRLSPVRVMV